MTRRIKYVLGPDDLEIIEQAPLSEKEKQVLRCVATNEEITRCAELLGVTRQTVYYMLRKAYPKYDEFRQKIRTITLQQGQPRKTIERKQEQQEQGEEETKPLTRVSPERQTQSASLRKLGLIASKEAEKLVKLYVEIGRKFYNEFKEIQAITGKDWETLVEEAYKTYILYQEELEEQEEIETRILQKIIETLIEQE